MKENLILIGMMGCGKSTVGVLLSARLGRELVDTDAMIEAQEGCSIPALFADVYKRQVRWSPMIWT